MTDVETQVVAESGAVVGLCPTTEANLGDGFFNADRFLAAGGEFGVGSDSHVSVSPVEELRWLEYGQRLKNRRRNVLVADGGSSTGRTLFERAVGGGARACGRRIGRIEPGYRADLIVLDTESPTLCDRQEDAILDAWIFSGNVGVVSDVFVGGRHVVRRGRCDGDREIAERFRSVMLELSA
jgi:formimidoylglutamate deiminase